MFQNWCTVVLFYIISTTRGDFCGKIFTEKDLILKSENYPQPYPEYPSCFYLIKGESCTEFFEFYFIDFNIKNSNGCTEERLEIGTQDALCGSKNGTRIYKAENSELKLKFVSKNIQGRDNYNKGFKLRIKRLECPSNSVGADETTKINTDEYTREVPYEWTTSLVPTTLSTPTYFSGAFRQCCKQRAYNSKIFTIVSPNFPFSVNTPEECSITILKSQSDICRLRIYLKFFYLGQPNYNSCPYGYLELDGKYICGCNSHVNLLSNFGYSSYKTLNFKTFGIPLTNSYSGFVLEIVQEECPKKYKPDNTYLPPIQVKAFRTYEEKNNRVKWPENIVERNKRNINLTQERTKRDLVNNPFYTNLPPNFNSWPEGTEIQKAKLLDERTYVGDGDANKLANDFSNLVKHIYYFAPEENNIEDGEIDIDYNPDNNPVRKDTTNVIDTTTINTILTNIQDYQKCCIWNQKQFTALRSQYGNNLEKSCQVSQKETSSEKNENCLVLKSFSGNIRSPNYPWGYPGGLNTCYRFEIFPGYCEIKLLFDDFQLEDSQNCLKDYLTFTGSGYRYCGSSLRRTTSLLNVRGDRIANLRFVSDLYNTGRGFSMSFQQIPCKEQYKVDAAVAPFNSEKSLSKFVSTLSKHHTPNFHGVRALGFSPNGINSCDKAIHTETFILRDGDFSESDKDECHVVIMKLNEDFCKLKLTFEQFDLECGEESVTVDNQEFCGKQSGQELVINMDTSEKIISYKKLPGVSRKNGMFRIFGRQLTNNCGLDFHLLPRIADIPEIQRTEETESATDSFDNNTDTELKDKNKDVCQLLKNSLTNDQNIADTKKIPDKICDILKARYNATECNFSSLKNSINGNFTNFEKFDLKLPSNKENSFDTIEIKC